MKILLATSSYWPRINGVTISVDTFAEELRAKGHEVFIFAPKYSSEHKYKENDYMYRFTSVTPIGVTEEDKLVMPWARGQLKRILRRIQPDIIHNQTEFTLEHFIKKIGRKMNIPVIQSFHTMFEEYVDHYITWTPKFINSWIFKSVTWACVQGTNQLVAPTELMAKAIQPHIGRKKIHIIPTGLKLELFDKKNIGSSIPKELLQRSEGVKKLLFVGRLGQEKNVAFLFPILKKLVGDGIKLHLYIIGDGPSKKKYEETIGSMGLSNNVTFTGYIKRNQVIEFFHYVDIFTFPSKTETQGLVTLESMACGTPVVAIGEMGTKEVMQGDNGGFMTEDDPQDFYQKLKALLTDQGLYKSKSQEALAYAKNWSSQAMTEKLLAVYEAALRKKRRKTS
jgi:1,2-diacylglycerol 3-alpha-glucosyltransferase